MSVKLIFFYNTPYKIFTIYERDENFCSLKTYCKSNKFYIINDNFRERTQFFVIYTPTYALYFRVTYTSKIFSSAIKIVTRDHGLDYVYCIVINNVYTDLGMFELHFVVENKYLYKIIYLHFFNIFSRDFIDFLYT